ncbi:MAG TPA: immunoglobulin domain-containing protein [Verrucomicrobiae bacterium]|jgi:hypothetical protein|nr:immunoglobulin domain-containing protein [Verrucomicrobiae bacterium]
MKKLLSTVAVALCCALGAQAQNTNVVIPPGKLAVFKAGDDTGYWNISTSKVQPCFVQVFDTATSNQADPLYSLALPTNAPNGIWINAHAGSEGGGISRAANREYLALEGYTGDILSPTNAKPSSDTSVTRGFGTVDVFGNEQVLYSDPANWFGLPPGVTQNNPTGIATADGTNFWGTGNVTGSSTEASGTLFYNGEVSATPIELQNYIQAAGEARIIGGTLYIVVPGGGIYNFLDPRNNDAVVPLPYDPNVPNPVQHIVLTNLFLNWGPAYQNIANFDMNDAGTIAYGADQTFGIVKFVNTGGSWQPAPYYFNATNLGTTAQIVANQGCFGICVDFSGTNPVIYATTMENGTVPPNNSQGNANQNRLIRIVDTGVDPGTNLVAETLATATSTNEVFRGIDFTPDVTPLITSEPMPYSTVSGASAFFTVGAQSVYPLSYQWLQNGSVLSGDTSATLSLNGVNISLDGDDYQCVVSNAYGTVTSAPAALTVTATAQAPDITNSPTDVTNYIDNQVIFASILPTGTEPFTYQWYFGGNPLSDRGGKYGGSLTSSLTISNMASGDAGSYYLVASNSAGSTSNLMDVLTVLYHVPTVTVGEPGSGTAFVGAIFNLTATAASGTPPLTYQWYDGTTELHDANEYSGTSMPTLTINPVNYSDAGSYTVVISNPGGSVTSQVAVISVLAPPPPSYVRYSNQVYAQNFDSLPDPGSNSVNSINNPKDPGGIDGVAYSLANPFDFGFPVITSGYTGGLGLPNTMSGWYGAADTLYVGVGGITRFGAQDGDQTTGGVIDFGPNDSGALAGTNRALGLLSTSTTGSTTFALKLINETSNSITNVAISFTGELWHNGTGARVMSFGYSEDATATNFLLTAESITNSVLVSNLAFSFPTAPLVTMVDGTQPSNQIALATNNMGLAAPWTPGGAIWLIWSINYYGAGSGNGYAIDNLVFSNASPPVPPVPAGPSYVAYTNADSVYSQNFDSLPYEPTISVNTANPVTINGVTYDLADPFDFAAVVSNASGGLGLSNTMPGWYGLGNLLSRFGATAGDQTTGGVLSFGPTNNATEATNRSLGLVATSSTGPTAFGVRFLNLTGDTLGQFNLAYSSELWRQTTTAKAVTNFYYLDLTGTNGFVTNIVSGALTNLTFATGATVWGTNGPVSSNYVVFANQALTTNWPAGAALWVVWEMDSSAGSAQGLGIDNLAFSATLATNLAPVITTEPLAQSVSVGQPASFSVSVSNLLSGTYQWYTNGVALANGNEISGATAPTLTINPTTFADAATYTVVISNIYGSATSAPVTLTVNSTAVPPGFTVQPLSQTNYLGSNTVLFASTTGTQPISYQWQFDGAPILGATATNLVLNDLQYTNAGTYTLVVTNVAGTNISQPAVLSVIALAPSFVTEPSPQTVIVGGTAVFSVSATGTAPLQYQWMLGSSPLSDGNGITGSQSNILILTNVQFSQAGSYSVHVSNTGGSTNSTVVTLTVVPGPSYVAYSNANSVYSQNFDSLPYEPTNSINTANPVVINGVTYSLGDPFDFAYVIESNGTGGLGLSNTMPGWYGLGNVLARFGATAGDQTTGGVLSFGPTNIASAAVDRSLGLVATSSTGPTAFGVRLLNLTGGSLNQFSLGYSSELWRQTTTAKTVTNFYYLDLSGTNGFVTNIVSGSLTNLAFATGGTAWGTNGPVSSNYVVLANQSFTTNWPAGAALWVVWEMNNSAGSGQGLGIDNLTFSAVGPGTPVSISIVQSNAVLVLSWPASGGTNLEVTSDLTLTNGWTSFGAQVVTTNGVDSVVAPITGGNQYFRLEQQ